MKKHLATSALVLMVACAGTAGAADLGKTSLPAVSAPNGKIEIGGGYADVDLEDKNSTFYGMGSFSLPLGESFGFQADAAALNQFGGTAVGAAGHLFTRDPSSHLLGLIGGYSDGNDEKLTYLGGEGEFYLDMISLEGKAGWVNVNPDNAGSDDDVFGAATLAFYPTENLRFDIGASTVAKVEEASIGAEYLMEGMPLSFVAAGTIGEDDYVSATAGIKFYFGGDDATKSLIRRHREDDPSNGVLFRAKGSDPEEEDACVILQAPNNDGPPPPKDFACNGA